MSDSDESISDLEKKIFLKYKHAEEKRHLKEQWILSKYREEPEPVDEYANEGEDFWFAVDMLISMYETFPQDVLLRHSYHNTRGRSSYDFCYFCGKFATPGSCEHYGAEAKLNDICRCFMVGRLSSYLSNHEPKFSKFHAGWLCRELDELRSLHNDPIKSNLTGKMLENIEKEKLEIEKAPLNRKIKRHVAIYQAIRFFEMMPSTDLDVEMRKINDFPAVSAAIEKVGEGTENEAKILEVISNIKQEISKAKWSRALLKRKSTSSKS